MLSFRYTKQSSKDVADTTFKLVCLEIFRFSFEEESKNEVTTVTICFIFLIQRALPGSPKKIGISANAFICSGIEYEIY